MSGDDASASRASPAGAGDARPPAASGRPPVAAVPRGPVAVPALVRRTLPGRELVPVWVNQVGGTTWRAEDAAGPGLHAKWAPAGSGLDLDAEAERLGWLAGRTPVPAVEALVRDDAGALLVTRTLPGRSAVDPRWLADPVRAVTAVGAGLRALHDALPVDACPWTWSAQDRLARVRPDVDDDVRAELARTPDVDRLVVCHGDACMPNTLLAEDGTCSAHVDVGALGVGDRWADLAVASWSTAWNVGPGYEDLLLEAYGVERDAVRVAYYRALWDAGP
ncbi:aminoglycoside 3'-phosphotransferase [uncultured Pseudokineococcus sp.]|uniref:aminoglycoside 3'-phosphotransferase n=1 Tax=uncultured Pseudokineococcus sp. TaxID=1642928 RepID=UPI0026151310|nr:aminoglycoside 3'-phosphotransferase [uncultured Pseudokineococcus sp.]